MEIVIYSVIRKLDPRTRKIHTLPRHTNFFVDDYNDFMRYVRAYPKFENNSNKNSYNSRFSY